MIARYRRAQIENVRAGCEYCEYEYTRQREEDATHECGIYIRH